MLFGVFDTETTGLPLHKDARIEQQPKVIEFGGIITDGKDVLTTCEFICNPEQDIEPVITEITGLTNDDLYPLEPFRAFTGKLKNYFSEVDVIITHNLSFDKSMVMWDLWRIGQDLPDISWARQIEVCTVEQTFHTYGRRMRLTELYNLLVGEYVQKHRAVDDTILLHEVCKKINLYAALGAK